ncbi:MAG: hypothetical protein ABJH04_07635 [Cyclobacteriaceae bacterium]
MTDNMTYGRFIIAGTLLSAAIFLIVLARKEFRINTGHLIGKPELIETVLSDTIEASLFYSNHFSLQDIDVVEASKNLELIFNRSLGLCSFNFRSSDSSYLTLVRKDGNLFMYVIKPKLHYDTAEITHRLLFANARKLNELSDTLHLSRNSYPIYVQKQRINLSGKYQSTLLSNTIIAIKSTQ